MPRAHQRLAARGPLEPRIRWPRRPPLRCSSAEALLRTPPSPPTLCSALSSRSARASAVTVSPSFGIPRQTSWRAWPAPAALLNRFRSTLLVHVQKMASCQSLARSLSPRLARSMAGGRCTSATESSSGQSCLSRQFITAKLALPCRRLSDFISSAIWRRSSAPARALKKQLMPWRPILPVASRPMNTMFAAIPILLALIA